MIQIKTENIKDCEVIVPGSKSYSHRLLIAAALSDGMCKIQNCLKSEDTLLTLDALKQLGVKIDMKNNELVVHGTGGRLGSTDSPVYLANSGTSMRLLTGVVTLGEGMYTLTGSERMFERPIQDLLDGLNQLGIYAKSINSNGCPPVEVRGGTIKGGSVSLKCKVSSQYLSSLLLMAPYTSEGLDIKVVEGPVSKPYIDMTVDIMTKLGVEVFREGYSRYRIPGNQKFTSGSYVVEPDCSQAGYFWAAAAISGKKIMVKGISKDSRQGDVRFSEVLEKMGCKVFHEDDGIAVSGGKLSAIEVDMSDMPDVVPTLAVVAAFAKGTTLIKNVAHLRDKESDRLGSVACELLKMGIDAKATDSGLIIKGGIPHGTEINTYNDHRIAMCFAVAGLVVPGIVIMDEKCVEKSFPNYWEVFGGLYE
ncbi:MAG: 3-phosphoshikimate 1-carboxyvinyltransferase [Desulfobacterales bacterium]|jgi:3-phosphoshikimate 1-carboxyvinyltransferase|nr:3-phosphoshikimate 1-carboxyvinyltransferase [Desulfobacteraceae bacterium]MBT4365485.1 3-phosphoshikimate 1-carboxyvinyltransferase [Desulfobacteraceae bacterium]MBT7087051.1 3-phosphoshikimate 1-carboxyvinyltransferase [Desulfobacterales bacterium]MBT7697584.1 3-phosphoshikimate 1-carboxyvinyltransferase [Desulfobacterales bacterium]